MIRFSTAGESHGEALTALISGLPAGVPVDLDFINRELWRRQQGYGRGGRMKIETDKAHILSGGRDGEANGFAHDNRDRESRLEELGRQTAGREGRPGEAPGGGIAAAGARGSCRRAEV